MSVGSRTACICPAFAWPWMVYCAAPAGRLCSSTHSPTFQHRLQLAIRLSRLLDSGAATHASCASDDANACAALRVPLTWISIARVMAHENKDVAAGPALFVTSSQATVCTAAQQWPPHMSHWQCPASLMHFSYLHDWYAQHGNPVPGALPKHAWSSSCLSFTT